MEHQLPGPPESSGPDSVRRKPITAIGVAIVLFVLTRAYILFQLTPLVSDVPTTYFSHAALAFDAHCVPYQNPPEGFAIEYPPLAWWVIYVPRLLDRRRIVGPHDDQHVNPIRTSYCTCYRSLMALCDMACFALLLSITRKRRSALAGWAVLSYTITSALLGHLLYDRIDVVLLLLLLLWAYCWVRSLEDSSQESAWMAAAYWLLGLSISFKLIPVVLVPFLLLSELYAPRRFVRFALASTCLTVSIIWPFVIQFAESGPGVFAFFRFHAERGIGIESLYAGIILIGSLFGLPIRISNTIGAFEIHAAWSPACKTIATVLLFLFLGGTALWALLRRSRYQREDAYCTACFVIAAVVILSNVFSPQFLIWAVPMMLLVGIERLPDKASAPWVLFGLILAMILLTLWLFPYNYFRSVLGPESSPYGLVPDFENFSSPAPVACVVLAVRNALYLGIVLWLGVMLFRRRRTSAAVAFSDGGNLH